MERLRRGIPGRARVAHEHASAAPAQDERGIQTGRAASDDDNVVHRLAAVQARGQSQLIACNAGLVVGGWWFVVGGWWQVVLVGCG